MSTKRARTDSLQGTKTHPVTWGLPVKFTFPVNRHWASPIKLAVEAIDLAQFAGSSKVAMEIMGGTYLMGGKKYNSTGTDVDTTVVIMTTSYFPVDTQDGISPLQLETDQDVIFRASVQYGNDQGLQRKDLEILPVGSRLTVVKPTIYLYAWRGYAQMEPNVSTTVASEFPVSDFYCSIKLAYYMTQISSERMLVEYIQESENASFLEFIPEV